MSSHNENEQDRDQLIVKAILARLNNLQFDGKAKTEEDCYFYQLLAAYRYGYEEPFTSNQSKLNEWLTEVRAGKSETDMAWKLYRNLDFPRI